MRRAHLGILSALAAGLVQADPSPEPEPPRTDTNKNAKPHIGAKQIAKARKRADAQQMKAAT